MDYREFKKTGANLSLLGFGAMRLPTVGGEYAVIDEAPALEMIDLAHKSGVNYFDTAWGYHEGNSESFLGKALSAYPRDSYHLATKLPMWLINTPEDALHYFDQQLARLQTDHFDYYLFHALGADSFAKLEKLGLYDLMDQKRKAGVIRNLGFSFHDRPPVLTKICNAHQWDFAQLQLNYVDWDKLGSKIAYRTLERKGIPCVVMEPVRGGALADLGPEANAVLQAAAPGRSVASWAMRWVASLPNVMCVLSGMSTQDQVRDNLATFDGLAPLSEAEDAALKKAVRVFKKHALVPCTACKYCMPCPQGLDIPGLIAMRNDCAFDGGNEGLKEKYAQLPEEARAKNCVACGKCEKACPQHIPIIETLRGIEAAGAG